MAVALSSLRSNLTKQLTCTNLPATFSTFSRHFHGLSQPKHFFSAKAAHYRQLQTLNCSAFGSSTVPEKITTSSTDDLVTSAYISVRICCPRNVADVLSESLMCFGASSTTIDEQESVESKEEIWIGSTFDVSENVKECIARAADSVGLKDLPSYEVEMQDSTDWIKLTQESFYPVEITERLWIVPEWKSPPDPQATNIILNPGLAFGTGEHPTTKLCLLLLHQVIKGGECFLDYGTGSGVLAIAALKLGAKLSVGFDIEPQSITSARYNAALNNIAPEKLVLSLVPSKDSPLSEKEFSHKDLNLQELYDSKIISEKEKYEVVVANILLHPLLDLAERIVSYAKPGALVGLSGIITEQIPSVEKRYSEFLENIMVTRMDDWACISGFKKTKPSN